MYRLGLKLISSTSITLTLLTGKPNRACSKRPHQRLGKPDCFFLAMT